MDDGGLGGQRTFYDHLEEVMKIAIIKRQPSLEIDVLHPLLNIDNDKWACVPSILRRRYFDELFQPMGLIQLTITRSMDSTIT